MTKYIFSINPGRAGSGYLCRLFKHALGTVSFHEPEPAMKRLPMIEFLNGRPLLLRKLMPEKLRAIQTAVGHAGHVYAESNHNFVKGFGWLIPEYIPQREIGVVILRRDPERVAKSMYRLGANAFNNDGRGALIHVNVKKKHVPLPNDVPFLLARYYYYRLLHRAYYFSKARPRLTLGLAEGRGEPQTPYELNLKLLAWYASEVYALGEKYVKTFPGITYFEIGTEDLNEMAVVLKMFERFGLRPKDSLASVVGVPVNVQS